MSVGGLTYSGPLNPNPGPGESRISIYGYYPSLALALVGLITFALASIAHAVWAFKRGRLTKTFHILVSVGCLIEMGGYAARTHGAYHPFRVDNFVAQFFLIVVAPVVFCAAVDLMLNILVEGIPGTSRLLLLKPRTILIIFVTTDAICTVVQIAGAALVGVTQSARADNRTVGLTGEQASDILLAGLCMQVASWAIFLVFLSVAIYRAHFPPHDARHLRGAEYKPMRLFLYQILAVTLLILLRACYRVAETAMGFFTGIANSEIAFAMLEFFPVILAVTILAMLPPSFFTEHKLTHGLRQEVAAGDREKVGDSSHQAVGGPRPSMGREQDSDGMGSVGGVASTQRV